MGKVIALDVGEKRLGVAHSDDAGSFSFPLKTINVDKNIGANLKNIIKEEEPDKIIVGLPRNMDGTLGFQAEEVRKFIKKYLDEHTEIIEYEDESVTSIEAKNDMKREGKNPRENKTEIDAYAAKIILESWIRRQ